MDEIFITEKEWQKFSVEEMNAYVEKVFDYYRNIRGFPNFEYNPDKNRDKFRKLINYDKPLFKGKYILQTMHGLDIANSYFPHLWEIKTNDYPTPMEIFSDDVMLKGAIRQRIKLGDAMSDNMMRKILSIYKGTKRVSNFRPTAARAIYERLNARVVYDMSAGFGGRLLGAMSSKNKIRYYGVEPSTKTFDGLQRMINDLKGEFLGEAFIEKIGSEDYIPPIRVDACFTSPPYFDTEKYSDEPTQSYIKFPTYEKWLEGFIYRTFENCYKALKPTGYLVINITNTNKHPYLEADIVKIATMNNFYWVDQWNLILSQVSKKTGYKTEPIFVFRRE